MISSGMLVKIFLISLAQTLAFETAFAWFWGIRNKEGYRLIALANLLTNPLVVAVYYGIRLHRLPLNYGLVTLCLETFAVLAEGFLYKKQPVCFNRPFLFSLSANAVSYAIGELLNQL